MFNNRGFSPVIVLIVVAFLGSVTGYLFYQKYVAKTVVENVKEQGTVQQESSESAELASPTVSPSPFMNLQKTNKPAPTPVKTTVPATPAPTTTTTTTTSNSSNSSSSSSSNSSQSQNQTSAPTATPTGNYARVIYPNGGESFTQGESLTVRWESNIAIGYCFIQAIDENNSGAVIAQSISPGVGSVAWNANMGNTTLNERNYKVYLLCNNYNGGSATDTSDSYFVIHK